MRTEEEILNLILSFAKKDERIKVVSMEGSRINKDIPKDAFQDYDVTYVVTDMTPFIESEDWLNVFGKRILMQKPEAMSLYYPQLGNWFSYLMLFEDGSRIDLTLVPLDELDLYLSSDSLLDVLLDKDELVQNFPTPSNIVYQVEKPTPQQFDDCCNEFWWVATYAVKGICREEFFFAVDYLNQFMRKELLRMISWRIGIENNFSVSVGKNYKFLEQFVSEALWARLIETNDLTSYDKMWQALSSIQELFRETSKDVAEKLNFTYPVYDENITNYIDKMYEQYH